MIMSGGNHLRKVNQLIMSSQIDEKEANNNFDNNYNFYHSF